MKVTVKWEGKRKFTGLTAAGHRAVMDSAMENGGDDSGARPTELLLMAVAGCTGIDIVSILEKMRTPARELTMEVSGERAQDHPKRFTDIRVIYRITGEDIPPGNAERAVKLSAEKYCSVAHSLNAKMSYEFELNGTRYTIQAG